jgi:hypothetical protein
MPDAEGTKTTYAERIRQYARQNFIQPALQRGDMTVRIRAGDVHQGLNLRRQHPNVCQVLKSQKFLEGNHLSLEAEEGPPSGQSSAMVFTYRLPGFSPLQQEVAAPGSGSNLLKLLELKGIGKELFASLGGGENFIRAERKAFADAIEKQDRERGLL